MAIRVAVVSALLGAAHLVQASPAYGHGYGNPYGGNGTTKGVVYTTEVVTAVTTYCPYATTLTYGDNTYTVTEPTTLTITDCPCTISKPVKPTTTPGVVYTTEVVTAVTTYCPYATTLTYGDHTYTVTEPTTLTITDCPCTISKPVKPTSEPVYTKPVYYTKEVVTAITTYCSEATTLSFNNKTYSVTGPTTLTITDCPCTIHKPVYSQPAGKDCPEECYSAYNYCRGLADANMATCASQYSNCLGYSPFGSDGSIIKPTACSHQPAVPTTNVPVNPTGPAKNYGTVPAGGETATATGPVTVPTGAAGRLAPGYVLAALGAAVLL